MKIFSIALNSVDKPELRTLSTMISDSLENAVAVATTNSNKLYGDHKWILSLSNEVTVQFPLDEMNKVIKEEVTKKKSEDFDKNWLLKTIVDHKDKKLFTAAKKYLSESEILYTTDKMKHANKS